MTHDEMQARTVRVRDLLRRWLSERIPSEGWQWLEQKVEQVAAGTADRVFFTSFSAVPRYTGKDDLGLSGAELKEAAGARPGWQPGHWSVDQAGRSLFLLALPHDAAGRYRQTLQRVFDTADVGESVALYQSLPLLPHPEAFRGQAAEGLRSNMTSVFNAVALRNPYPAEQFDDNAWNQMVLKAVFVGSPLHLIQGLDARANASLARMLVDFAHERWAAHRSLSPEVWRLVGPFAGDDVVADLERVLNDEDPAQQEAAALALSASPSARAREALAAHRALDERIRTGTLTWESFRARLETAPS